MVLCSLGNAHSTKIGERRFPDFVFINQHIYGLNVYNKSQL